MSRALQAEPKDTQNGEILSPAPKGCLQAVSVPSPQGTYWPLSCGVKHLFVAVPLAASRAWRERGEIQHRVMTTAGVSSSQELPQPFQTEDENQRPLGQEGTQRSHLISSASMQGPVQATPTKGYSILQACMSSGHQLSY